MTTVAIRKEPGHEPIVVLVLAAIIGAALFMICAADELAGSSPEQAIPSLVGYALGLLVGLPMFAGVVAAVWKVT